jgi:hypothetical protein
MVLIAYPVASGRQRALGAKGAPAFLCEFNALAKTGFVPPK